MKKRRKIQKAEGAEYTDTDSVSREQVEVLSRKSAPSPIAVEALSTALLQVLKSKENNGGGKYPPLKSGEHWITTKDDRKVLIDGDGNIVGGNVPEAEQGHKISDMHPPKVAPPGSNQAKQEKKTGEKTEGATAVKKPLPEKDKPSKTKESPDKPKEESSNTTKDHVDKKSELSEEQLNKLKQFKNPKPGSLASAYGEHYAIFDGKQWQKISHAEWVEHNKKKLADQKKQANASDKKLPSKSESKDEGKPTESVKPLTPTETLALYKQHGNAAIGEVVFILIHGDIVYAKYTQHDGWKKASRDDFLDYQEKKRIEDAGGKASKPAVSAKEKKFITDPYVLKDLKPQELNPPGYVGYVGGGPERDFALWDGEHWYKANAEDAKEWREHAGAAWRSWTSKQREAFANPVKSKAVYEHINKPYNGVDNLATVDLAAAEVAAAELTPDADERGRTFTELKDAILDRWPKLSAGEQMDLADFSIGIRAAIGLYEPRDFFQFYATNNVTHSGDLKDQWKTKAPKFVHYVFSAIAGAWSESSNSKVVMSLLFQNAARRVFGLNASTAHMVDKHDDVTFEAWTVVDRLERQYKEVVPSMDIMVQLLYDTTQQMLKRAGIKDVMLYRGAGAGTVNRAGLKPGDAEKSLGFSDYKDTDVTMQPINSFSCDPTVAYRFMQYNSDRETTAFLAGRIPAEYVLSTSKIGIGCAAPGDGNEHEYLVLGVPTKLRVASHEFKRGVLGEDDFRSATERLLKAKPQGAETSMKARPAPKNKPLDIAATEEDRDWIRFARKKGGKKTKVQNKALPTPEPSLEEFTETARDRKVAQLKSRVDELASKLIKDEAARIRALAQNFLPTTVWGLLKGTPDQVWHDTVVLVDLEDERIVDGKVPGYMLGKRPDEFGYGFLRLGLTDSHNPTRNAMWWAIEEGGRGMTEALQEAVFHKFHQAQEASLRGRVDGIVDMLLYYGWDRSEAERFGTDMWMHLLEDLRGAEIEERVHGKPKA